MAALGLLALVVAGLMAQTPARAYVFALDGSYAALDLTTLKIGPVSLAWQKTASGLDYLPGLQYGIYGAVSDAPHGRVFLRVGLQRASDDDGYLVFDLADERVVGALGVVGETDAAVVKPDGTLIYVSYLQAARNPNSASRTATFDGRSYRKLDDREVGMIAVSPVSCFVNDRVLYTPHRFIDVITKSVRRGTLFGQILRPIACRRNRLLLLSLSEQRVATLTVHDVAADRRVVQFDTGVTVSGYDEAEWRLTNDGRRILRDELAGGDRRRTGHVTIWDADSGRREGDITLDARGAITRGLIGVSEDSSRAFYHSGSTIWILDVAKAAVAGRIDVPFDAVAVVAP
jgi:hypothetical protein